MNWLKDSNACLSVSKETLEKLETLVPKSLEDTNMIPFIKVYVKNTLENLRSPLDYSANFVFDTYCRDQYNSNSDIRRNCADRPQFPLNKSKTEFEKNMSKKFKNLSINNPDVYQLIESMQYYNGNKWLQEFNNLVNSNKHNNLSKQAIKEKGIQIKYLETTSGNKFIDCGAFDSGKDNIVIGDIPFNEKTAATHPYVRKYDVDFYYKLTFGDSQKEVLNTLDIIYTGVSAYIKELNELINEESIK